VWNEKERGRPNVFWFPINLPARDRITSPSSSLDFFSLPRTSQESSREERNHTYKAPNVIDSSYAKGKKSNPYEIGTM
jgi:hypothetical protein